MTEWIELGRIEAVPQRGARCITTPTGKIAVFRTANDQVYAMDNRCPHKGGPLSQGMVHGHAVTCPLHNWVISLATGQAQGNDKGCTPTIPVRVDAGRVLLCRAGTLRAAA